MTHDRAFTENALRPVMHSTILQDAKDVLEHESKALKALSQSLGDSFVQAVDIIQRLKGRLIVSGIGKSGHIARKIAATLASTGQPSFFVHAAEASHGDLGMITKDDGILMLSASGETHELKPLLSYARRFAIPIIGMTRSMESALATYSTITLLLPDESEACPMGLAPTTSTTMMLGLGDALSVCLLKAKQFSPRDYGLFHPGGSLGEQLTTVGDKMHQGREIPLVKPDAPLEMVVSTMTSKGFGCVGIVDNDNVLLGMITDGDIRRLLERNLQTAHIMDTNTCTAETLMTINPSTVTPKVLMADALRLLQEKSITSLFILDEKTKSPIGLIHIHDFLKSGVI